MQKIQGEGCFSPAATEYQRPVIRNFYSVQHIIKITKENISIYS